MHSVKLWSVHNDVSVGHAIHLIRVTAERPCNAKRVQMKLLDAQHACLIIDGDCMNTTMTTITCIK